MSGRIAQAVYMGVGASGAMTDVSSYVDLAAGISYSYGRQSEFDDAAPGTFSFTLDNADGRFTPENTSSPYATKVTEGMTVSWQAGSRIVAGSIIGIEPAFPGDDAAWSQVVITCDDMLGAAARFEVLQSVPYSAAIQNSSLFFPLDDPANTTAGYGYGLDSDGLSRTMQSTGSAVITYGVEGIDGVCDRQVEVSAAAGLSGEYGATSITSVPAAGLIEASLPYTVGVWVTPMNSTSYLEFRSENDSRWRIANNQFQHWDETAGTWNVVAGAGVGITYFVELTVTTGPTTSTMYINGTQVSQTAMIGGFIVELVKVIVGDAAYGETQVRLSQISVSSARLGLEHVLVTTESARLALLGSLTDSFTLATLPTGLSTARVAPLGGTAGDSALDLINDVIRAEQGHIYARTTGTVSSPTRTVVVRERDRPTSVTETFDVEDEGSGAPSITRDVTNLVASVSVANDVQSVRVASDTLTSRTTASTSETTVLYDALDMRAWGEDRIARGANTRLRIQSATVDAFTTPTDRSGDLLGLVPGDRVQITDLPSTVLGFSTWDGWLLGASETHSLTEHTFEMYFQPVLDAPTVYNTGRYMSGSAVTLNATINSAVTSLVYATTGPEMESTAVPYTILIDSEQLNVTAVNQGTNTATVTRGANGTTAASHTAGAAIELASSSLYAF